MLHDISWYKIIETIVVLRRHTTSSNKTMYLGWFALFWLLIPVSINHNYWILFHNCISRSWYFRNRMLANIGIWQSKTSFSVRSNWTHALPQTTGLRSSNMVALGSHLNCDYDLTAWPWRLIFDWLVTLFVPMPTRCFSLHS